MAFDSKDSNNKILRKKNTNTERTPNEVGLQENKNPKCCFLRQRKIHS